MRKKYSNYFKWGLTAFAVIASAILFYFGLDYIAALIKAVGSFLGILSPFIWGLIISYLLLPIMKYYERKIFVPMRLKYVEKHPTATKDSMITRTLALILAEISLLVIIVALFYLIVPQLYESIATIVVNSPARINKAYANINTMLRDHPQIEQYTSAIFGNLTEALTTWAKTKLLPGMENIVTNITNGVYYVLKTLYNVIIGIIVSVYILYNKESVKAHVKKLMYCVFPTRNARQLSMAVKFTDKTIMGFISGKLLDSAIIGAICYVGCLAFKMPYSLLVAVIVGITNIIPFFGPFIGAIPCSLLILIVSPVKCLIFVIFIFALQQFDGNILGPKILGSSIGINGFWVMFSIILFGGLFGFWGMLLGVPVFVIIYTAAEMLINRKLEKKNLPTDLEIYEKLKSINPETGEITMKNKD